METSQAAIVGLREAINHPRGCPLPLRIPTPGSTLPPLPKCRHGQLPLQCHAVLAECRHALPGAPWLLHCCKQSQEKTAPPDIQKQEIAARHFHFHCVCCLSLSRWSVLGEGHCTQQARISVVAQPITNDLAPKLGMSILTTITI